MPDRILATLETLRDQVRDEILKDPRYLTFMALERSIHDIKSALAGPSVSPASRRIAPPAIEFAAIAAFVAAGSADHRDSAVDEHPAALHQISEPAPAATAPTQLAEPLAGEAATVRDDGHVATIKLNGGGPRTTATPSDHAQIHSDTRHRDNVTSAAEVLVAAGFADLDMAVVSSEPPPAVPTAPSHDPTGEDRSPAATRDDHFASAPLVSDGSVEAQPVIAAVVGSNDNDAVIVVVEPAVADMETPALQTGEAPLEAVTQSDQPAALAGESHVELNAAADGSSPAILHEAVADDGEAVALGGAPAPGVVETGHTASPPDMLASGADVSHPDEIASVPSRHVAASGEAVVHNDGSAPVAAEFGRHESPAADGASEPSLDVAALGNGGDAVAHSEMPAPVAAASPPHAGPTEAFAVAVDVPHHPDSASGASLDVAALVDGSDAVAHGDAPAAAASAPSESLHATTEPASVASHQAESAGHGETAAPAENGAGSDVAAIAHGGETAAPSDVLVAAESESAAWATLQNALAEVINGNSDHGHGQTGGVVGDDKVGPDVGHAAASRGEDAAAPSEPPAPENYPAPVPNQEQRSSGGTDATHHG